MVEETANTFIQKYLLKFYFLILFHKDKIAWFEGKCWKHEE